MEQKNAKIIALAWPDTKVIHEGKWYDVPMKWSGFIKDGYYNAGHAAFLLINLINGEVHYFDYGRYHTPVKYGRVRDKSTDPDIEIKQKALIHNDEIKNLADILLEVTQKKATHGIGRLTASVVDSISFEKAFEKAKQMQNREAIPYGPFELKGTTCSRFVVQVVLSSSKSKLTKLLIRLPYTISATPRSNNKVLNDYPYYYEVIDNKVYYKKSSFYPFKRIFSERIRLKSNKSINLEPLKL